VSSWSSDKGRMWQAYREIGALGTLHMGIWLTVVGIALMLWGVFEQGLASAWKRNMKMIWENWGKEDSAVAVSDQTNE